MSGRSLVVVGAGPAGLSAAAAAAAQGMDVTLIEESDRLGGQYFRGRQEADEDGSPVQFARRGKPVRVLSRTMVVDAPAGGSILVWQDGTNAVEAIVYDRLVVATGAYDRPVALPGWTLPGVMTAGGASTLAKVHGMAPGRRVLLAGSGPFLLSVANDLLAVGAEVEIAEATPWHASARGLGSIMADPEIARQTIAYLARLARHRVRRHYATTVTAIHGSDRVTSAALQRVDAQWRPIPGTQRRIDVDAVCLGFGFVPHLEVAQALGCEMRYDGLAANYFIRVDERMRTSRPGVYAAGEVTGIAGKRVAAVEGALAGLTAAADSGAIAAGEYDRLAASLRVKLRRFQRVAEWIRTAFAPRDGLWSLASATTAICRCEEVTLADAEASLACNQPTPYAVKTMTRAGMGLCQGRICGPYLIEWLRHRHGYSAPVADRPWRVRPPLRPVPLGAWPGQEAET